MTKVITWLYIAVSAANVLSKIISSEDLDRYTKPLLMPILLYYVYKKSIGNTTAKVLLISGALLFSWFGDVALMYQSDSTYFIMGIGLFLIAQILYAFTLRKATFQKPEINLTGIAPFVLYGAALFYILLPAGDFTVPILIYGLVILVMAYFASSRKNLTSNESYQLAFLGSLLFVLSDSLLAINSFKTSIPLAGVWIMSTYCAAQFLLVAGLLKHID